MDSQIPENGIVLQSFKLSSVQSNSNFSPVPQHVKNETRSKKRGKIRVGTPLPQHTANLLSFTSSYWLTPLIYQIARSQKEVLDDDAVWSAAPVDGCQENAKILGELWERELRKKGRKKASLFKCCVQFVGPMFWRLLLGSVFFALSLVILTLIQKMKEVLNSIRLIKMWAWEKPFLTEIIDERKKETSKSKNQTFLTILGVCQIFQTPALATAITLTLYSYFGNTLNTELDFLLRPDVKTESTVVSDDQLAVEMKKACFHWPSDLENGDRSKEISNAYSNPVMDEESDTEIDSASNVSKPNGVVTTKPNLGREPVLKNISFEAKKGSLIGICGPVGSGKSALVSALLGQMTQLEGSLAVNGTIAICPQEAWIFNDTLRENILFGSPYNKDRYEKTLDLTSLRTDVESFPVGDQTEIGDRGITLSGGQRQRLSLARALYSDRDIYLLDDPFSALDVTVGQQVFTRCIKQGLREKTVILTTHQLQYLQDCDLVIYLENGTVSEMGTHAELMEQAKEYSHMIKSFYEKTATKEVQPGEEQAQQSEKAVLHILDAEAGRLTEKESMGVGNVTWACYATYIRSLGGATAFLFLLFCFMLTEGIVFACDWWLSAWLQQVDSDDVKSGNSSLFQMDNVTVSPETEISDVMRSLTGVSTISISMDRSTFVLVYGIGIAILFLTNFSRSWILAKTTINSSHVLHKKVLAKVMSSPVSFFDSTPSGRIMNRFSADIDMLDTLIPMDLGACLMVFFRIMIAVGGIAAIFPLLLVSLVPAVIAVMIIGRLGRASSFQMKRMDNVTRSKLLDHVTSTAQGLVSVRTYEKENMFTKRLINYLDTNSTRYMLCECCIDWTVLRGNFVGVMLSLITSVLVVVFRQQIPSQMGGLALSLLIQAMTLIGPLIQFACQFEARMTSVERLDEYIKTLKSEGLQKKVTTSVAADWPRSGDVTFNEVCMAYDTNKKLVLKNVSFSVISGQSIGIIGRTGAGKSSLGTALFRLVELSSGSILIDGVDIAQLSLHQLRSRLSVIPQEPVLFAGSLRRNLDPINTCTDEDIWTALEKSQLKEKVYHLPGQLEYYVENNGENFSVGERQLICMTRALLRNAPIVLLDEATASVDTETDSKIQLMLKEAFWDRTVLIIAHRLNTVQHCHKILVMDAGTVHEFDTPQNLMNQPNSLYRTMLSGSIARKTGRDI
ncbi:ATP-binding cassette sub-family C member 5-like [Liolophura sinensis]|uniref:ATP-binding cassette sub-family C member 5-like n=1 Tax=Liolophura sinensis TaxID=3198878 RepID=UPI0031581622